MNSAKRNILIYRVISLLFFLPIVNYFIGAIYIAFGLNNPWSQIIYFVIYSSGIVSYFIQFTQFKAALLGIFTLLLSYSVFLNTGLWEAITEIPSVYQSILAIFCFIVLPIFLITSDPLFDLKKCLNQFYKLSKICNILCIIAFICQLTNFGQTSEYMAFAYTTLPSALICIYFSFFYKDKIGEIISITTAVTLLFGGCRGALLTIIVFITFIFLFSKKSLLPKLFIGVSVVIFFLISIDDLLVNLSNFLNNYGVQSRIINFANADAISSDSGRELIWAKAISLTHIYGNGIFSDRVLLGHILNSTYCHNWVLEFLFDFGYLFGGLLVITIVLLYTRLSFSKHVYTDAYFKFILIYGISMLLAKYSVSGSYLQSYDLAFAFGGLIFLTRRFLMKNIATISH